jgi:hypothetical protein
MTNLSRQLAAYTGTVYLVDKQTGAIRQLPQAQYLEAQRLSQLGGFAARLSHAEAVSVSMRVFQETIPRN